MPITSFRYCAECATYTTQVYYPDSKDPNNAYWQCTECATCIPVPQIPRLQITPELQRRLDKHEAHCPMCQGGRRCRQRRLIIIRYARSRS